MCRMGCGRAVLHWAVAAWEGGGQGKCQGATILPGWESPTVAAQFIPDMAHNLDVPKLESHVVSHWQLGLPLCSSEGCERGGKSPQVCPRCCSAPHRCCCVQAQLTQSWLGQWQVGGAGSPAGKCGWAEAGAHTVVQWGICTELVVTGSALLFTCRGSAAAVLGAAALVLMPQAARRVHVSSEGSCIHPVAQSSLQVGKAGQEPWESIRRDGQHGSPCQGGDAWR